MKIYEKIYKPLSIELAQEYSNTGHEYAYNLQYNKALEYLKKALPGYVKHFGEESDEAKYMKQMIQEIEEALRK